MLWSFLGGAGAGALAVGLVMAIFLRKKIATDLERLSHQKERFELAARATNDIIWDWDLERNQRWWSEGFRRLCGGSPPETDLEIDCWMRQIHPHDKAAVLTTIEAALESEAQSWSREYRLLRADGRYIFVLDRGYILRNENGKALRMIGSMMDISSRKESEQELQRLTGRILEAQEEERSRVARELHDGVNQILSAAKFRVQLVEEKLGRGGEGGLRTHTGKAKELLDKALQEVRSISHHLRPSELDDLGLLAAVRSGCDEFQERTGVEVEVEVENFPEVLAPEIELALYRILQEALGNVEKHAGATRIGVRVAKEGMMLALSIRDNGRGFDPRRAEERQRRGLGMANMKERAAFVGGTLAVNPLPGRGLEIVVRIPAVPRVKEAEAL